jgi:hypothetical protein
MGWLVFWVFCAAIFGSGIGYFLSELLRIQAEWQRDRRKPIPSLVRRIGLALAGYIFLIGLGVTAKYAHELGRVPYFFLGMFVTIAVLYVRLRRGNR